MKTFIAFLKKEVTEQFRTGHTIILFILFILFGIMNPAISKLTPWMMELLSDSLEKSGMIIKEVDALTSWTQFYKNIPLALIIFVLTTCGTLTGECQKGTLIPILTKGLSRIKVVLAKFTSLSFIWTGCFWLCYIVTYVYSAYFWDNSVAQSLIIPSLAYYLFGMWIISLVMLFSSFSSSNTGVIIGTGAVCVAAYLLSLIPKLQPYTPMRLNESLSMVTGMLKAKDILLAVVITFVLSVANIVSSSLIFKRRKL